MTHEYLIGQHLKELRAVKNVTQDDVSAMLNVKRQTYSAYERGVSVPDALTLKKLADYFGVSTDYLLNNSDNNIITNTSNDDLWDLRKNMAERPEMKTLFSLAKTASTDDINFANDLLKKFRGESGYTDE